MKVEDLIRMLEKLNVAEAEVYDPDPDADGLALVIGVVYDKSEVIIQTDEL